MLTYIQALIMGAVQGITELFPISSLGHSVILPSLFGWNIDQQAPFFLLFLIATHFATSLVLLCFFIKDWVKIVKGIFRSIVRAVKPTDAASHSKKLIARMVEGDLYARLGWLLIAATVPAGLIGLVFQNKLAALFASPILASVFLMLNGIMLYVVEKMSKKNQAQKQMQQNARVQNVSMKNNGENAASDERISNISWVKSFKVGLAQCLALLPGFSRTGSTLGGSLLVGLDHEDAVRFSFLMATPIILAASALKLPQILTSISGSFKGTGILSQTAGNAELPLYTLLIGTCAAAVAAFISVKFLIQYFKTKTLSPFALYCVVAGALSFFILSLF